MRVLLDTNVLIRSAQPDHPSYATARNAVNALLEQGESVFIVPQNLYEFWVVGTRSRKENGLNLTVAECSSHLRDLKRIFILLRDERAIQPEWERLVAQFNVRGKKAHDARLVAAMHRHRITHILSFNAPDFSRFTDITVLTPEGLLGQHVAPA